MELSSYLNKYINIKETESSILVNGKWGSGKTYYIRNYMQNLEDSGKDLLIIYYSLKGISDTQKLVKSINLKLLLGDSSDKWSSFFEKFDLDYVSSFFENKFVEKTYKTLDLFSDVLISSVQDEFLKKVKTKTVILFLDDLERISEKLQVIDLLAEISTSFTEFGIKTIYIADETDLLEKAEYKKAKEKYIHRTLSFNPNKKEVFEYFLKKYTPNTNYNYDLYDMFITVFSEEQPNLRAVKFAFLCYQEILECYESIDNKKNYDYPSPLFYSICAYSKFYIAKQISKPKLIACIPSFISKYLEKYENSETNDKDAQKKDIKDFFHKYENNGKYYLYTESFLFDHIYDGILDSIALKQLLKRDTEDQDPLNQLTNLYQFEMDEVEKKLKEVYNNLTQEKYSINSLSLLIQNFYSNLRFVTNLISKDDAENAIVKSIFSDKQKEELSIFFEYKEKNNYWEFPKGIESVSEELEKRYTDYINNKNKTDYEKIIECVNNAEYNQSLFYEIDEHKLFGILLKEKYFDNLENIKNNSILFLIKYINSKIIGLGNAYQFYMTEIPALQEIQEKIKTQKELLKENNLIKAELLGKFDKTIEQSIKHIYESRNYY